MNDTKVVHVPAIVVDATNEGYKPPFSPEEFSDRLAGILDRLELGGYATSTIVVYGEAFVIGHPIKSKP